MSLRDLHTHTNFCDGKNSPEEMVIAAIEKGLDEIGLVCHSYTEFDQSYCIKKEDVKKFQDEVKALREKYKDKIRVLCGVEQDYFSDFSTDGFDYVIGSVHYVKKDGKYLDVDLSEENFVDMVKKYYGGDYIAFCEDYFALVCDVASKTNADIIGHFDLVTKFNEGDKFFSTSDARYISAAKKAIDNLVIFEIPFEVNTGAVSRGYRLEPYPSKVLIEYIKEKGGKLIMSGDSHSTDSILSNYEEFLKLI